MIPLFLPPKGSRSGSFGASDAGSPPEGARYPSVPHRKETEGVQFPPSAPIDRERGVCSRERCHLSPALLPHYAPIPRPVTRTSEHTRRCPSSNSGDRRAYAPTVDAVIGAYAPTGDADDMRRCGSPILPSVSAMVPSLLHPLKRNACSPGEHYRLSGLTSNERTDRDAA